MALGFEWVVVPQLTYGGLVVPFANFSRLLVIRSVVNVGHFKGQQIISLFGCIAFGGAASKGGKEQVIDRCTLTRENLRKELHIAGYEERIRTQPSLEKSGVDHSPAYTTEGLAFEDLGINLLVELVFKVADLFCTLVFDTNEADGLFYWHPIRTGRLFRRRNALSTK